MSYPINTTIDAFDTDATLDSILAMRQQEESAYQVTDYLSDLPKKALHEAPVDDVCRRVMAKWCSDIADFCKYSRETVSIAMNCLDRFMATEDGRGILLDRGQYQLAAMTALYTTVKIYEHEAMDPALVSSLSRGAHSAGAVEAMERRMLTAVRWRVNPPTAFSFIRKMLALVPDHLLPSEERETILELANFQADLATSDVLFSREPASKLALAALLNAVENACTDPSFFARFETKVPAAVGIEASGLRGLRIRLYECISGSTPMDTDEEEPSSKVARKNDEDAQSHSETSDYNVSPRTVYA